MQRLYSGLYFLGIAIVHFYGIELVLNEILDDSSSKASYHRQAMVQASSNGDGLTRDRMILAAGLAALALVAKGVYCKKSST